METLIGQSSTWCALSVVFGAIAGWLLVLMRCRKRERALLGELRQTYVKLDAAEGGLRQLETAARDLQTESRARNSELAARVEELEPLKGVLRRREERIGSLESELAQLREAKSIEIESLRQHLGTFEPLQRQLDDAQAECNRLKGKLQQLTERLTVSDRQTTAEMGFATGRNHREFTEAPPACTETAAERGASFGYPVAIRDRREDLSVRRSQVAAAGPAPAAAGAEQPEGRDDLKQITGIGPVLEKTLNSLGITTFAQIGRFSAEDVQRVGASIHCFSDRIIRDDWIGGARRAYRRKYGSELA